MGHAKLTSKPEVNCRYQAFTQACAFHSPFLGMMSDMGMLRQSFLALLQCKRSLEEPILIPRCWNCLLKRKNAKPIVE
jgi:hypothetical protein